MKSKRVFYSTGNAADIELHWAHDKGVMHTIGMLEMIMQDRHNWLDPEGSCLNQEQIEDTLVSAPSLAAKLMNHNMHLCRTVDRLSKERDESEEKVMRWLDDANAKIADLEKEIKGYKTALKLTEDADG